MPSRHLREALLACLMCGAALAPAVAQSDTATVRATPPAPQAAAPPAAAPAPPAAAPAPAAQAARPSTPWRLGTEIAFTDISGNRQLQLFQSSVTVARQSPQTFNFDLKLEGRYGESNGQEAARSAAARVRLDWTSRAMVSPFLGFDAEYDHIRKIDARISGGMGINVNIVRRDATRATASVGVLEEYVNYAAPTSPGSVSDTRYSLRLAYTHTIRPGVQVECNVRHQPAADRLWDYLVKADAALRVALTTRLGWRTTYSWNRDSTPASGVKPDDRTLTTGLLIQWW